MLERKKIEIAQKVIFIRKLINLIMPNGVMFKHDLVAVLNLDLKA